MGQNSNVKQGPKSLEHQADEILAKAEAKGVQTNFFFQTTFARYRVQMRILGDLEEAIGEYGATVTKEYVKGRENLCANPAISEYNKTATAANGTVATLINIIKAFAAEESNKGDNLADAMAKMLSGVNE